MARLKFITACIVLLSICSLVEKSSAHSPGGIFISEVMWNGSSASASDEWLELYNYGDKVVNLDGYSLFDDHNKEIILQIQSGQIASKGNFLISNNDKGHSFSAGESVLDVAPDLVNSSLSISNSNLKILLLDPGGNIVDQVGDGGRPFFYDYKKSSLYRSNYELSGDQEMAWSVYQADPASPCLARANLDANSQECATPTPSGKPIINLLQQSREKFVFDQEMTFELKYEVEDYGSDLLELVLSEENAQNSWRFPINSVGLQEIKMPASNSCPKLEVSFFDSLGLYDSQKLVTDCYDVFDKVWISEVMPHPISDFNKDGRAEAADEYIEIVNDGAQRVNLRGWRLIDASGQSYEIGDLSLEPYGYVAFFQVQTGIKLNDTGEVLKLLTPFGDLASEVSIPNSSSRKDQSYSRWADRWYFSSSPTPGSENIITELGSVESPSKEEMRGLINKKSSIEAEVVEVERSNFTVSYLGHSVAVYPANDEMPKNGQLVKVEGRLHGGLHPTISSGQVAIITKRSVPTNAENSIPESISSAVGNLMLVTRTTHKTVKTIRKSKSLISAWGKNNDRVSESSKITQSMIYLSGLFSLLLIILLYDFFCRE